MRRHEQMCLLLLLLIVNLALTPRIQVSNQRVHPLLPSHVPSLDGVGDPLAGNWSLASPTAVGNVRLVVVAVQFVDVPHTRSVSELSVDFFGDGPSLSSYFTEVSYGQLSVSGTVLGWFNSTRRMAYYGADGNFVDNAKGTMMPASFDLVLEAQELAKSSVIFSDYDCLMIVHSGAGQETSKDTNLIWSVAFPDLHEYSSSVYQTAAVVPEKEERGVVPLGVYAHEFAHLLGLPDLYRGRKDSGAARWELMDHGAYNGRPSGSMPAELSAWSRIRLGWLGDSSIITLNPAASELVLLNPIALAPVGNSAVKVTASSPEESEFYMVEVRQPLGFDRGLPDHGVITYHIRESSVGVSYSVIQVNDDASSLHLGDRYAAEVFAVKVVTAFSNGSYLVGFGEASNTPTQTGFTLTVAVSPATSDMTITVDGQTYVTDALGQVTVRTLYNSTTFNISVPDLFISGPVTRLKFQAWSDGTATATRSLAASGNVTVTAQYQVQYYVNIASQYGSPSGADWYNAGSSATISVPSPVEAPSPGTRYVFDAWTGDLTSSENPASFTVSKPMNITATWTTQFYLTVDSGGHATVSGSGWYGQGATASFTLVPPKPLNGTWYIFRGWIGDYNGASPTGTVTMNSPITIEATWTVLEWVHFIFTTANSNGTVLVSASRVSGLQLMAPNGTQVFLEKPAMKDGVWLESGSYRVVSALVFGVNCTYGNESFATSPNGDIRIELRLFSIAFDVRDIVLGTPISGTHVNVTMPDGSVEGAEVVDGWAVLPQVPVGTYPFTVSRDWALMSEGKAVLDEQHLVVAVHLIMLPSLALILGVIFAAVVGSLYVCRRRARKTARLRSHKTALSAAFRSTGAGTEPVQDESAQVDQGQEIAAQSNDDGREGDLDAVSLTAEDRLASFLAPDTRTED